MLTFKVHTSPYEAFQCKNLGSRNYYQAPKRKYNYRSIPTDFMKSPQVTQAICQLIDDITLVRENQSDVDQMYDNVVQLVFREIKEMLPPVSKSGRRKNTPFRPYWCPELSELWRKAYEKEKVYVNFKGCKRTKDQLRLAFISARNCFDKTLRQRQRIYRRGMLIDIEQCDTSNPRKFWKYIHKLGPKKNNSIPLEVYDSDGNISYDKDTVLKTWENEYKNLLNSNDGIFDDDFLADIQSTKAHLEQNMQDPLYTQNTDLNKTIDLDEVRKVVNKSKLGKACGTDELPNEVLKNENMVKCLHALFQMCFDYSMIPSVWSQAIISPIPKSSKNDPRLPLSYRGLSLLSCIYKLYSAILNNRVLSFLESNELLHEEQNGFRKDRSCVDHIFSITSIIRNKLNEGSDVYVAYVDFRKAFDLVNRDMLLFRMLEYGIDGKMYFAIKNIYAKASCSVRVNDLMTNWFDTSQGVKQGDNLSPTCFLTFINPLLGELKKTGLGVRIGTELVSVLAYADDLALMAENEGDLQKLLDVLFEWCRKWRLSINTDKTKVMHFRQKGTERTIFPFNVNHEGIDIVDSYKYLGIVLEEHLDFSKTAELLACAAGRALGTIINKVKSIKDVGYNTFSTMVESCVVPILTYGSGSWALKSHKCCDDVLLRASRFYMGVHRLSAIPGIQGDMGWLDCPDRWSVEIIRLYNRFVNMDHSRLNRALFLFDKSANGHNWSKKVKKVLSECNLENLWNRNQQVPLEILKSRLAANSLENWRHKCSTKPKLRTYITFKNDMDVASHLCCNMPKYERSLISQLRLGILPLRIETGRYSNLEVKDRTCLICDTNNVEDEEHFLFNCEFYSNERSTFETGLNCNFADLSTTEKFKLIFKHPYKLAKYLKTATDKRKDKLYRPTS